MRDAFTVSAFELILAARSLRAILLVVAVITVRDSIAPLRPADALTVLAHELRRRAVACSWKSTVSQSVRIV